MSEKSRLLSNPPPKSPILGDFEEGVARKSYPKMGGWGASVRIFDTSQTSSKKGRQGDRLPLPVVPILFEPFDSQTEFEL